MAGWAGGCCRPLLRRHRRLPGIANLEASVIPHPASTPAFPCRYNYLNLDDAWSAKKRVGGLLVAHPRRFPAGIKALGDYIHSKGLKFGIYGDAGVNTCAHYPGGCSPVGACSVVHVALAAAAAAPALPEPPSQRTPPPSPPGCRLPRVRDCGCPDLGRLGGGLS